MTNSMKTQNYDELIALFRKWKVFFESLPDYYSVGFSGPLGSAFWDVYPYHLSDQLRAFLAVFGEFQFGAGHSVVEIWIPYSVVDGKDLVRKLCPGDFDMGDWLFDAQDMSDWDEFKCKEGSEVVSVNDLLLFGTDCDMTLFAVRRKSDEIYHWDYIPDESQQFFDWFADKVNYALSFSRNHMKLPET